MVNGNILSRNDDFNGKLYTCQPHKVFYTLLEFPFFSSLNVFGSYHVHSNYDDNKLEVFVHGFG